MKKKNRSLIGLLLALTLLTSMFTPALAVENGALTSALTDSSAYMLRTVTKPVVSSIGGEWAVIGLARSGYTVPQSWWDGYYAAVEETVEECKGVLHEKKYTDYSRVVMALTAIGADPTDVAGYNLLTPLGDFDKTIWQGINGPIWALIALDSGSYAMPQNPQAATQATRQMYVDEILSRQLNSGGWNLADKGGDGTADPDITGMALQALAKYQGQSKVKEATEKALNCLSKMQDASGGFSSWNTANSESCVQVIVALCELGIDLEDERFVKAGNSLLDNLLTYWKSDGSFLHIKSGSGSNQMASEQGLYGLAAVVRAQKGQSSLYRMNDVTIRVTGSEAAVNGLPGKNDAVQKTAVTAPGKTFTDISGHANQTAVETLAARGIIDGMGNGTFAPNATMNRAQFATIVVRALGLTPQTGDAFTDVPDKEWYAPYVGTAYAYGIINGVGGGKFNPEGTITRQDAALMVARAAKLCGMDIARDASQQRDILSIFPDYRTIDNYASEGMAFCYDTEVLSQADDTIRPKQAILRCEIAQMLCNLLGSAKLL